MRDPGDEHEALAVIDGVHDPIVADQDPEVWRTRVGCEPVDRRLDPVAHGAAKPSERSCGFRVQPDLVHPLRAVCADVAPRDRGVTLVAGLERSEAVLEIVEPLEELGVPL